MKKDLMIRNSTEELENTKLNIPIEENSRKHFTN